MILSTFKFEHSTQIPYLIYLKIGTVGFFALFTFCINSYAQELKLEGRYQGRNLFVQNPIMDDSSFCVTAVSVNSIPYLFNPASAFEIDFTMLRFKIGDTITVIIQHQSDCKPKVLNPEPPSQQSNYVLTEIDINSDGKLIWKTKNEEAKIYYIVQSYRWNKWVTIGEVESTGIDQKNSYYFNVKPHSGKNVVRIKTVDYAYKSKVSEEVTFVSTRPVVKIETVDNKTRQIQFSDSTAYELYDEFGNMLKKGYAKEIDCSGLHEKVFFLNYDNMNSKVVFKKE